MKLKILLCVLLMICLCPLVVTAADKDKKSESSMDQLKNVEKNSKDAAKDARAGKEESARDKAGRGWEGYKTGK